MIKNLFIFSIIIILNSCSFDTRSGIWTEESISLSSEENRDIKELFKKEISNENEFNPNLKLEIKNFSENKNRLFLWYFILILTLTSHFWSSHENFHQRVLKEV